MVLEEEPFPFFCDPFLSSCWLLMLVGQDKGRIQTL